AEKRPPPSPRVSAAAPPSSEASAPPSSESQPPGTLGSDEPHSAASARPPRSPRAPSGPHIELPGALVRGAPALVMGRAVRQRFTGCLAFEVDQGLRRVVFKDGDVVISASAVHGESLV